MLNFIIIITTITVECRLALPLLSTCKKHPTILYELEKKKTSCWFMQFVFVTFCCIVKHENLLGTNFTIWRYMINSNIILWCAHSHRRFYRCPNQHRKRESNTSPRQIWRTVSINAESDHGRKWMPFMKIKIVRFSFKIHNIYVVTIKAGRSLCGNCILLKTKVLYQFKMPLELLGVLKPISDE